jgi:hypothetical protein
MYIFPLFFLLWPCILAGHFVFTWVVQTLVIVYMTFVVFMDGFGFLLWLCVYGYVYGCMFMDVFGYVFGYVFGVCVWVMCMDTGSRSSARPGSINIGAYLSLGPVSIIIGTYSLLEARFYHRWDLLLHEARFYHHWDLLLHEAHLNDSPNFFQFFSTKMEKFAPVCNVKQIFLAS